MSAVFRTTTGAVNMSRADARTDDADPEKAARERMRARLAAAHSVRTLDGVSVDDATGDDEAPPLDEPSGTLTGRDQFAGDLTEVRAEAAAAARLASAWITDPEARKAAERAYAANRPTK